MTLANPKKQYRLTSGRWRSMTATPISIPILGGMYHAAGQPEKANASFDKVCTRDVKHQQCRFNKGMALFKMDKPDKATAGWRELLAIHPDAETPDGRKVAELIKEMKKE